MSYNGSKAKWCGRELSHYEAGKGLKAKMPLTSPLDSTTEPVAVSSPKRNPPMVYLIRSGKYIKIGMTTDIRRRIETLQIGNPIKLVLVGLVPGGTRAERHFQDRFGEGLHRGEWFKITPDLKAFIDQELIALNETAVEHIATNRRVLAQQAYDLMHRPEVFCAAQPYSEAP